jgi:hypothetical protein
VRWPCLEGHFSEEGLAALSDGGLESMALAKALDARLDDVRAKWAKLRVETQEAIVKADESGALRTLANAAVESRHTEEPAVPVEEIQALTEFVIESFEEQADQPEEIDHAKRAKKLKPGQRPAVQDMCQIGDAAWKLFFRLKPHDQIGKVWTIAEARTCLETVYQLEEAGIIAWMDIENDTFRMALDEPTWEYVRDWYDLIGSHRDYFTPTDLVIVDRPGSGRHYLRFHPWTSLPGTVELLPVEGFPAVNSIPLTADSRWLAELTVVECSAADRALLKAEGLGIEGDRIVPVSRDHKSATPVRVQPAKIVRKPKPERKPKASPKPPKLPVARAEPPTPQMDLQVDPAFDLDTFLAQEFGQDDAPSDAIADPFGGTYSREQLAGIFDRLAAIGIDLGRL